MGFRESLKKETLTSEKLKALDANQFDLVNRAIKYAREIIRGQHTVEDEERNVAAEAIHILEVYSQKDE